MLTVCEMFRSIQGESTFAGEPCAFVRLCGCNLHCSYCDTAYAREGGEGRTVDDVHAWVRNQRCRLVEITGGEPLLQKDSEELARRLCDDGHTVLVETNGSLDISALPEPCVRVVDVKCPGSGEAGSFYMPNLGELGQGDECKFVLCHREDYLWARDFVGLHRLAGRCTVIFSPAWNMLPSRDLADWIIADDAGVRLGLQLQKVLWGDSARGR